MVMLYHQPVNSTLQRPAAERATRLPYRRLIDFQRHSLGIDAHQQVEFTVNATQLGLTNSNGDTMLYAGIHTLLLSRGNGRDVALNVSVEIEAPLLIDTLS